MVKSVIYEVPHYSVFSTLFICLSQVQIFSLSPCYQIPSIYVIPLLCGTKFHKTSGKIIVLYVLIFRFTGREREDKFLN
jgi:hypothetical protein